MTAIDYSASSTAAQFHADTSFVRAILGCVGSGKTAAGVIEILRKALAQTPDAGGVRRTRTVVIRQSYPQLVSTVIKTFTDWLGGLGKITFGVPIQFRAKFPAGDGTMVDMEVIFLALERAEDAAKLRSLEVSHAMVSEFAEIPIEILNMLRGRIGRYPSKRHGAECFSPQIWLESNPFTVRSHWYKLFEEERPKGHKLFRQPPPLFYDADIGPMNDPDAYVPNPLAENVANLPGGYDYYLNQIPGAAHDYIKVYILGEYGATYTGQPVFPEYDDKSHCPRDPLKPVSRTTLVIGMDLGLHPAAVPTELTPTGALHALAECAGNDMMLDQFLDEMLRPLMHLEFRGWPYVVVTDPSDNVGKASYIMMRDRGMAVVSSPTNNPELRWDAVRWFLLRRGGFMLSPVCSMLREGFLGGYAFKKTSSDVNSLHLGRVDKQNPLSHPMDALGYAAVHHRQQGTTQKKPPPPRKRVLYA